MELVWQFVQIGCYQINVANITYTYVDPSSGRVQIAFAGASESHDIHLAGELAERFVRWLDEKAMVYIIG